MNCPACHTALIAVEREGIEVDWCLDCRGLWFDEGEIELLAEKTGRTIDLAGLGATDSDTPRRCPRCDRNMKRQTCA